MGYYIRKIERAELSIYSDRLYKSYYGGIDIDFGFSSVFILGYRMLFRYIRSKYDLSRYEYEMLVYYCLAQNYCAVELFIRVFGINLKLFIKHTYRLSSIGLIEPKNKKYNCRVFRITPKGREVCEDIEHYWRYNIRK